MSSPSDSGPLGPAITVGDTVDQQASQYPENGMVEAAQDTKKKKKGKNNRSKAAKKRGTGFEEYYCDAPMTPAQFEEEQRNLYPAHRPFVERIEECIQRFRASRRMDSDRNHIFSRYLIIGGVDATPRQFQSTSHLNDEALQGRTKAEVRDIVADDVIQRGGADNTDRRFYNPHFPEHWDVDFSGVAAGFLSEQLVDQCGMEIDTYRKGAEVVSNFLKYVDRHDVCPEYTSDVRNAQQICQFALEEIPLIAELSKLLPGSYNRAASMLFSSKDEIRAFEFDNIIHSEEGFDQNTARTIFGVNLAMLLDPGHGQRAGAALAQQKLTVTDTFEQTFEVANISFADDKCRARYKKINAHLSDDRKVEICGSLVVHPTVIRNGFDNPTADAVSSETTEELSVFFLEESILKHFKIGLKLQMIICTMNENIKFIKSVKGVYPTFYTFLAQELMLHYKEPAKDNRPAPSVYDPEADPNVLDDIPFGDPEYREDT